MTDDVRHLCRFTSLVLAILFSSGACRIGTSQVSAQAASPVTLETERAATVTRVTTLRDAFIARIHSAGFTCPIAAPTIVVEDVPSFGQYQPESNILRTSDWTVLRPEEKAFFVQLAGPGADESTVHTVFEKAAHGWIFVHELGHWWQACSNSNVHRSHYQVEYGANRIALAYWRETDPGVVTLTMSLFHGVLDHVPSPVPAGQEVEDYFDKNYETLGPSPAYPWFQSRMNVTLEEEKPAPTLVMVLASVVAQAGVSQDCRINAPDTSDGVLIAPQNHKVLYETEDVRVMEVTVAPHTKETMHTHARPAVMYLDQPGANSVYFASIERVSEHPYNPNFKPIAIWLPPEELHAMENTGDTMFHAIRVEFKHPGCSLSSGLPVIDPGPNDAVKIWPEGHRVLFENEDVRVLNVRNAPHSKEPFHTHLWPGFFYVVQGEPMKYSTQDGAPPILLGVPPVRIIPLPPNPMHSVENLGDREAHFIRFELKHASSPPASTGH